MSDCSSRIRHRNSLTQNGLGRSGTGTNIGRMNTPGQTYVVLVEKWPQGVWCILYLHCKKGTNLLICQPRESQMPGKMKLGDAIARPASQSSERNSSCHLTAKKITEYGSQENLWCFTRHGHLPEITQYFIVEKVEKTCTFTQNGLTTCYLWRHIS